MDCSWHLRKKFIFALIHGVRLPSWSGAHISISFEIRPEKSTAASLTVIHIKVLIGLPVFEKCWLRTYLEDRTNNFLFPINGSQPCHALTQKATILKNSDNVVIHWGDNIVCWDAENNLPGHNLTLEEIGTFFVPIYTLSFKTTRIQGISK
ncbi:hypothetical protein AVEN_72931-1 [Araneus ventricosus]|uniref:Uncharacterized protein n=1 Tax=Araneus ventricosus TaxID=182803 RepID=A0A4Y2GYK3_ARAVE|nr:hypothetical protein AVEN_72931-1 [Araneus ventricosus]